MKHHQIHRTNNATYLLTYLLGLSFDEHLNCTNHVQHIICKVNCANAFLRRNISCPLLVKKMCYLAMVLSGVHTQTVTYTS